jgi:hypothetical protein
MRREDLVGTWRKVSCGPARLNPADGYELLVLRDDGTAAIFGRFKDEEYANDHTWEYLDESHWTLRSALPAVPGYPGLEDGMSLEVMPSEVVYFSGDVMETRLYVREEIRPLFEKELRKIVEQNKDRFPGMAPLGSEEWHSVTRYERVS